MRATLRKTMAVLASFALLGASSVASAEGDTADCPLSDRQFSDQVDALDSWAAIHAHQQRHFPPCADDGLRAQAHAELVVRTLVATWTRLPELAAIARENPEFRRFVFRHIDARANKGDLQTILAYATIQCPRGQAAFCAEIRAAAGRALQVLQ